MAPTTRLTFIIKIQNPSLLQLIKDQTVQQGLPQQVPIQSRYSC